MQINKLMPPPCAAQSKSYQGPLTMSGDSDIRHMPSPAQDAKRPRAFLKQPTHSSCIFFTPSSRHVGIKPCAVFTRLRPNISLLFPSLSCWQGDPGEAGLVKRLHKGARESTIQCRQAVGNNSMNYLSQRRPQVPITAPSQIACR